MDPERAYVLDRTAALLAGEIREDLATLTVEQVGRMLQLDRHAVRRLPIPEVRLNSRVIRYRASDVRAFLERQTISPR